MIKSYAEADKYLGGKIDRPIKGRSATRIMRCAGGDGISIEYHGTAVVTYYPDGRIHVCTGGHHTMTTRARISEFTPRAAYAAGHGRMKWAGTHFFQHATLHPDGTVSSDYSEAVQAEREAKLIGLRAEAREWAAWARLGRYEGEDVREMFGSYSARGILGALVQRAGIEARRETNGSWCKR